MCMKLEKFHFMSNIVLEGAGLVLLLLFFLGFSFSTKQVLLILNKTSSALLLISSLLSVLRISSNVSVRNEIKINSYMKTLSVLLAYIVIVCAIILPVWTIWYCIEVNCSAEIIYYLATCTFIFSSIIIFMIYKCIKLLN